MLARASMTYVTWMLGCLTLVVIGYWFSVPWLLIPGSIACIFVPPERVRVSLLRIQSQPLPPKLAWKIILILLLPPSLFGLWFAFQVEPEIGQHRANVVVVWMLFYCLFPLCLYAYWFLNLRSWIRHHNRLADRKARNTEA